MKIKELRSNPAQNVKYQSGWAELAAWAKQNNVLTQPSSWGISMTNVPKLGINPGRLYTETEPRGIYFYPFAYAYNTKVIENEDLPLADEAPYIQLFQYSGHGLFDPNKISMEQAEAELAKHLSAEALDSDIRWWKRQLGNGMAAPGYKILVKAIVDNIDHDDKKISIINKALRNLGYNYLLDNGKGWIHPGEKTQGCILDPRIINKVVTFNNYTRTTTQVDQ